MPIHPTAIVDKAAEVDPRADIGPWAIVEGGVVLHRGVRIMPRVHIFKGTEIGENSVVHPGSVIGNEPQDVSYKGEPSYTKIGKNTVIREYATVNRATGEGKSTVVGDNNFLMVGTHVAHNCRTGDEVTIANHSALAGHVTVEKGVFISGGVVFHQFCRIGRYSMIGGFTGVNKDVPPYMIVRGPSVIRGVNLIGLKRSGMSPDERKEIKEVYRLLYLAGKSQEEALSEIKERFDSENVRHMVDFIESSKRGICKIRFKTEEYFN